jgi:hypothetical protein
MLKNRKPLVILYIAFFIFGSCTSTKDTTVDRGTELDNAIRNASEGIINNIPMNTKVVLLNISDFDEDIDLTDYFIEELGVMLDRSRALTVVERRYLESLSIEHNFQMSGYVSDESMISIGKYVGAQTVVSVNITGTGNLRRLRIRALDVETAIVQYNNSYSIGHIDEYTGNTDNTQNISDKSIDVAFDTAIRRLIEYLPHNVSRISLQNITSEDMELKLAERLIGEFIILERNHLRAVGREIERQNYALGRDLDIRYAGVDVIIVGGEYGTGALRRIVFRAIKVETCEQIAMVMELVNDDELNLLPLINNIYNDINNVVPSGIFTIWDDSFKDGIDSFIEDGIETRIIQSNWKRFVTRKYVDLVNREIELTISGYITDETSVRIGYFIGANTIINIGNLNNGLINITVMDVETAQSKLNKNYTYQQ